MSVRTITVCDQGHVIDRGQYPSTTSVKTVAHDPEKYATCAQQIAATIRRNRRGEPVTIIAGSQDCPWCNGTGVLDDDVVVECDQCNGAGVVAWDANGDPVPAPDGAA